MKPNAIITSLLLAFLTCSSIFGQADDEKLQLHLLSSVDDSVVRLRWAPGNVSSWNWGIENGFQLSRLTVATNGVEDSLQGQFNSKVILDTLILPLPENGWGGVDATEDQVNLARGAIYSPSFIIDSMLSESDFTRAFADQSDREHRFMFGIFAADQSFEVAQAMGLGYLDTTVTANKVYFYIVEFLGDVDTTHASAFGTEVDMEQSVDLLVPSSPEFRLGVDTNVMMAMDITSVQSFYTSYNVERSDDNISFSQVNESPLVPASTEGINEGLLYFSDIVPEVSTNYYYRYYGVTPFGDAGPFSDTLQVITHPSPKSSPPKITDLTLVDDEVKVEWTFPSNEQVFINRFRIYRANNPIGPFNLLDSVAVTIRTWTDEYPIPSGYYRIVALDKAPAEVYGGDRFIQLEDTIPPLAPVGLNCIISNEGLVLVSWDPVEDPGLKGYRVFSGNSEVGTFGEQTTVPDRDTSFSFQTNLHTLTEALYIKVQAIDLRENYSEYSDICTATRPDIIPPSRPILSKANPLLMGVSIEWINSTSEDVTKHQLQRKRVDGMSWTNLIEFDPAGDPIGTPVGVRNVVIDDVSGKLIDTLAAYPLEYEYRLLALDEAENTASSEILRVRPYDSGLRGQITTVEVDSVFDVTANIGVNLLAWNYSHVDGLFDFQIYRSVDGKPMTAYATTNGRGGVNFADSGSPSGLTKPSPGIFQWKDFSLGTSKILANSGTPGVTSGVPKQRTYKYQIMARHFDGGWSPISEVVELTVWVPGQ